MSDQITDEQNTDLWDEARKYKFTSSRIFQLLTEPKSAEDKKAGKLGATAKAYVLEKIVEELDGFLPDYTNEAMAWGNENEPKAVYWYEKLTGNKVLTKGFFRFNEFFGGSPDSIIELKETKKEASLEIKCPFNSTNHLKHCLIDSPEYFKKYHSDYYWQCISHMIVTSTNICHFVSFDPRINHQIGFFLFELERNQEDVELLLEAIKKAQKYKVELMERWKIK